MRISSLYIDNFGLFHNESLENIEPGLALFQGHNEAGKSTLLGFIRTVLFGFPDGRSKDPQYPPLNGSAPGGRIGLVNSDGLEFLVERKPGPRGVRVLLQELDGMTVQPESLDQVLGGLTKDVFKNIFAFSLTELQTFDTLNSENVKSAIYGASAGTGAQALSNAYRRIETQMDGLFRPKAQNPSINQKLRELEAVQGELREARKGLDRYDQACGELAETEQKIRDTSAEFARLNRAKRKYENFDQLWPDWLNLLESEEALGNLADVVETFPENGLEDYRAEKESLDQGLRRMIGLKTELEQLDSKARGLEVDTALLEMAQDIVGLFETKNKYTENREQIPLFEQKLGTEQEEIAQLIVSLGSEWSEESALKIDRSLFTRDAIRLNEENLNKLQGELSTAARILADKKTAYKNLVQEESRFNEEAERLRPDEPEIEKQIIQDLRDDRNVFANAMRDIPVRETELELAERELARLGKEIDLEWTAAILNDFDLSMAARQKVEDFAADFSRIRSDIRTAQTVCEGIVRNLDNAGSKYKIAISRLESTDQTRKSLPEDINPRRTAISALKNKLPKRDLLESDLGHQEERLSDKKAELDRMIQASEKKSLYNPIWLIVLAALAAALIFTQTPGKNLMFRLGVLGMVILVLAMIYLVIQVVSSKLKSRFRPKEKPEHPLEALIKDIQKTLSEKQDQHSTLQTEIKAQSFALKLDDQISVSELENLERQAEEDIRAFEEWARFAEEAQQYKQEVDQLKTDLTETESALKKYEQCLDHHNLKWGLLLEKMRLNPEMTTAMVIEVFSKVETSRQQLSNIQTLENRIREMRETRDRYLQLASGIPDLEKYAEAAGSEEILPEIDRFFVKLDKLAEKREQYRLAETALEAIRNQTKGAEKALKEAEEANDEAVDTNAEAVKVWRAWLYENGIPKGLSPTTTLEALDLIDKLVQRISTKDGLSQSLKRLKSGSGKYEDLLKKILDKLNEPAPDAENYAMAAEEQHTRLNLSRGNLQAREIVFERLEEVGAEIKTTQADIELRRSRIEKLFKTAGAENDEEFLEKGRLFSERKELLAKSSNAEHNMRKFSGEPGLESLKKELSALTVDEIQVKDVEIEQEVKDVGDSLDRLRDQKAEKNQTIETLKSAEDLVKLRAAEERALTEIRQDAHKWSVYSLAKYFMDQAREKFEKEQQPKVIREASGFFKKITRGRYESLRAPMGEDAIEAVTPEQKRKTPGELSRGTAEQLYLSLRFGYIRNYASTNEPLPVIMDDILVNFDPVRARGAAEAIMELAGTHQILFFTCHPETVDVFKSLDPSLSVYGLEEGHLIGAKNSP